MVSLDSKKATPRENLTSLAISFFIENGNSSKLADFSNIIEQFYYENDDSEISKLTKNIYGNFNLRRIKDLYHSKDKALAESGSQNKYTFREYKKDFPYGKEYSTEEGTPTNLDAEIKSAYLTAEILNETSIIKRLSEYIICDQSSEFMKIVKDDSLKKTLFALKLPSSVGSDILSAIDIILVRKNMVQKILKDFTDHIAGNDVDNMTILNNLAYKNTGKNTFRTLTNKYFFDKDMVGISLKKIPSNRKAKISIVGTIAGAKGDLEIYLDPYTEFLGKIEEAKSRAEIYKLVNDLVEITRIMPTNPRTVFIVEYKLKYKDVDISDKVETIKLEIGRSGFNAGSSEQMAWVGGISYTVTLPILKKYPRYNQMVREMVSIREKAFKHAVDEKKIPQNLKNEYNKMRLLVTQSKLVLYENKDNIKIRDFCRKYDEEIENKEDSFQEYRMGVSKLCKNKLLNSVDNQLKSLNKENLSTSGVPKTLHNDYVHSQGLYMYTRENENLKKFFKEQISLTLYGLMSKKDQKLFYSKQRSFLTESAFVKEFKSKNNKTKLAKLTVAPYVLIN